MATGFGIGFDLDAMLDSIKEADKALGDLMSKSNQASKSIINAFQQMSREGVVEYTNRLEEQIKLYSSINAAISTTTGRAKKGYGDMKGQIVSVIDSLTQMMNILQNTQFYKEQKIRLFDEKSKAELQEHIKQLDKLFNAELSYQKRMDDVKQANAKRQDDEINRYRQIQSELKKLNEIRNQAKEVKQTTDDKKVRSDANKTLIEANKQLRYYKEEAKKIEIQYAVETETVKKDISMRGFKERMKLSQREAATLKQQIDEIAKRELQTRVGTRTDGKAWGVSAEDVIKRNQEELRSEQRFREQKEQMYRTMFDTIERQNKKALDERIRYEQSKFNESLENYRKSKEAQASVDKHYHDKRQREYEEMFRQIDELAKKESQARSRNYNRTMATGDTTQHALNSYNRLMGDKGLFNLNNAQKVISQLEQAQAKVNIRTQEGQKAYANLGNAINAVRGRMREYGAQTDALRNKHQGLMDISGQLARRLALVFSVSQITNYARKIIDVRRQFELQHRSLQILIQDQDKANDLWNQTVALALKSPFRVKELVTYTKQLAAYRIETEKLHDTTKMLADVSAGLGVDMNRLILAFGQIKAANFLRGTELRQLTEAGIPMLDELAKHFNDMNKTALTSADVFEMISKRMVTFKDVESVFKRITSEGGVFYNMQEQQAETLHGMISNLGDSFDLMMNSIGQANDGIMKDTISSIKTIVDNWRVFAEILKQVAVLLASIKVAQFAQAWRVASGSIASATIASEGMVLTCSKLRRTLVSLKTTMMGHPLLLIGTLVASGISALMAYNDAIDETNKKYDEASTKELRKRDNLLKINKEVEKNNAVLKDSTQSEQELERARKANENQLKLLKNDYPQINNYIKIQKDGTINLTRAIEEQNRVLQANIALQQASKRSAFQQDLSTNYADVLKKWADFTRQLNDVNAFASTMLVKLEANQHLFKDTETYNKYRKIYEEMSKARSDKYLLSLRKSVSSYNIAEDLPNRELREQFQLIQDEIWNVRSLAKEWKVALRDLYDNLDKGMSTFVVNINRLYNEFGKNANSDKFKKQGGKFITESLKNLGITDERTLKEAQKYIQQEVSKALNIKLDLDFSVDKGKGDGQLADWAKRIKPEVEKFNEEIKKLHPELDASKLFPVPEADTTWEQYENLANGIIEIAERTYQEGQKIFGKDDIAQTQALKLFIEQYKNLLNINNKNKKKADKDEQIKILNRRIQLIKDLNKAYEENLQLYGKEKAEKKVRDAYRDTFIEAFEDTGVSLSGLIINKDKLSEIQKAGDETGKVFSEAMLAKMNEVAESGTYIRKASDTFKENLKKREGFVGYIYNDADTKQVKTQIKTLEDLYKFFDEKTGKRIGKGTLTIGYGHALQTLEEAKEYLGITLSQSDAEKLLIKDINAKEKALNHVLNGYRELIVTQEQYDSLLDNIYQGGLEGALKRARGDLSLTENYIKRLDEDFKRMGTSFAQEFGEKWFEEYKQLPTFAEKFAKQLQIASITTKALGSHIDPKLYKGMKERSAQRYSMFSGDIEVVKLLQKAAIDVSQIDFTNIEGVIATLKQLAPIAKKEGKEAELVLSKVISEFESQIGNAETEKQDKTFMDNINKMFNDYEIGLELKELDIPSDWAKQFFNVDTIDLSSLKKHLQDELESLGVEGEEKYRTFLKNKINEVTELENKANKERLKTYLEYARGSVGERAKIKLEEVKKLREIEETFGDKPENKAVKDKAIKAVKKETKEQLAKFDWEEFKGSDTFIKLFSDLDNASSALIEHSLEKLKEFKEQWKNMRLENVKEIVTKINELEQQLIDASNPFKEARKNRRDISKAERNAIFASEEAIKQKEKDNYESAFQLEAQHWEEQKAQWEQEVSQLETVLRLKEEGKTIDQVRGQLTAEEIALYGKETTLLRSNLTFAKGMVETSNENAQTNQKNADNYATQRNLINKQAVALQQCNKMANDLYDSTSDLVDILGAGDGPGKIFADMAMDMSSAVLNTIALQMQLTGAKTAADAFGASMNSAMGVIGWIVMAVNLVTQALSAVFQAQDKALQEQIEHEQENIQRLEHELKKLEKAIESAFSSESLNNATREAQTNLDKQISSYQNMINAEEQRKKADQGQIDDWKRTIEDLQEEREQLKRDLVEQMGGTYDVWGQAEEFANAWLDSFKETGNGLKGLQESFNEFFKNIVIQQAVSQGMGRITKNLTDYINTALEDSIFDELEQKHAQNLSDIAMKEGDLFMQQLFGDNGLFKDWSMDSSNLSGLSQGIQGVTEETAQIIEAYLNSIRFMIADNNSMWKRYIDIQLSDTDETANPILSELKAHTTLITEIRNMFSSVIQNGKETPLGGQFLKVVMG